MEWSHTHALPALGWAPLPSVNFSRTGGGFSVSVREADFLSKNASPHPDRKESCYQGFYITANLKLGQAQRTASESRCGQGNAHDTAQLPVKVSA